MDTQNSQPSHSHTLRRFLAAAAIGLGLGAAGASFAVPPDAPRDAGPRGEACTSEAHGATHLFPGREVARLHDELKLDAKQEALWKEAEQATRDARGDFAKIQREERDKTIVALAAPNADLRAVLKAADERRSEGEKRRLADRERWLAVYDSLNPTQKERARTFLRQWLEHAGGAGEHHHHGEHGGR